MSYRLLFDYVPSTVTFGEPFEIAIIVVDGDGDPQPDVSGPEVTLSAPLGGLDEVAVEVSGGEAVFSDVVVYPDFPSAADAEASFTFRATCTEGIQEGVSDEVGLQGDTSLKRGGGDGQTQPPQVADEDTNDISELIHRLKAVGSGAKVKHFLQLIKGRMWGLPGNDEKIAEGQLCTVVNNVLEKCDTDEAIECVALYQELLTNLSGKPIFTCGACRAAIRPPVGQPCFQTPAGLVFHNGCLLCKLCGKAVGASPLVRDEDFLPYHAECVSAAPPGKVQVHDKTPITCSLLDIDAAMAGNTIESKSVKSFLQSPEKERFIVLLKSKHMSDSYVAERVKRMMTRLPPLVASEFSALQ